MELFRPADFIRIQTQADHITDEQSTQTHSDYDEYQIEYLSGLSVGGKSAMLVEAANITDYPPISATELAYTQGEWFAVGRSNSAEYAEYIVFSDPFGYSPLFYSLTHRGYLIASYSFHGVIRGLKSVGALPSIDVDNYVAAITNSGTQFANIFSNRTMAREVYIAPPDALLYVSNRNVALRPRADLTPALKEMDEIQLMSSGVSLANRSISQLLSAEDVRRVLNLSGGVDSRLILALLLASANAEHFPLLSADPRKWQKPSTRQIIERDIEIANEIRSAYNLDWWEPSNSNQLSLSFMESLAFFQSHRSNYSYDFSPASSLRLFTEPVVSLRGGGGELLRYTVEAKVAGEQRRLASSEAPEAEWLATQQIKRSVIHDRFRDRIYQLLINNFAETSGATFEERLNDRYFRTRNRAHFGHLRHSLSSNELPLHVLSNIYFLEAARRMDFDKKKEGALVREIFSVLAPDLLAFPFQSNEWTAKLTTPHAHSGSFSNTGWEKSYDEKRRNKATHEFLHGWQRGQRREEWAFDPRQSALHYLQSAFKEIESFVDEGEREMLEAQHNRILLPNTLRQLPLFQLVSKAASALDVHRPTTNAGARIHLSTTQRPDETNLVIPRIFPGYPSISHDGINNYPVLELHPTLTKTPTGFRLDAHPRAVQNGTYEFAFYLYRDEVRISTVWYQAMESTEFRTELETGMYKGIAFARPKGQKSPTFRVETTSIEIAPGA